MCFIKKAYPNVPWVPPAKGEIKLPKENALLTKKMHLQHRKHTFEKENAPAPEKTYLRERKRTCNNENKLT
jgi:hypothetical protein